MGWKVRVKHTLSYWPYSTPSSFVDFMQTIISYTNCEVDQVKKSALIVQFSVVYILHVFHTCWSLYQNTYLSKDPVSIDCDS